LIPEQGSDCAFCSTIQFAAAVATAGKPLRSSPPDCGNRVADVDPRPKMILGGAFDFESKTRSEVMFGTLQNEVAQLAPEENCNDKRDHP
jgi:hypothetical protein